MIYALRTSFYENDVEGKEIGKFDCRVTIEESGRFDNALSVYHSMLSEMLNNIQAMESEVDYYGR